MPNMDGTGPLGHGFGIGCGRRGGYRQCINPFKRNHTGYGFRPGICRYGSSREGLNNKRLFLENALNSVNRQLDELKK